MGLRTVTLKLSDELLAATRQLARQRDVTMGQVVRDALAGELLRTERAKTSVRMDERLLAPLRALLAGDLAAATGWDDLDRRLKARGYRFAEAGGGLVLRRWPGDERVCKASELGFAYRRLTSRFGAPFPGHAHGPRRAAPCDRTQPFDVVED